MDTTRMIKLAQQLVSINSESPPGREEDVAKYLREFMKNQGISCRSVGPSSRPNLLFSTHDGETGDLVLHGHMDTVPAGNIDQWSHDPFSGAIESGRLYGRGACDMKGPLATLAETLICYKEEKHKTPLLMLATSDEESGCSGAEEVAKSGILKGVTYGVCAEPTSLNVLVGEKGMLWTKILATGKSAHGSRPNEGINAIDLCMRATSLLLETEYASEPDDVMGEMTVNLGIMKGGVKINVVPSDCESHLDMRLVKGQTIEGIMGAMQQVLDDARLSDRVEIEYIHGKPAVITPRNSKIVERAVSSVESIVGLKSDMKAATYGTDCSVLQPKIGIINIICGPGSIEQAHQPNEFIEIEQMEHAVDVYLDIARQFVSEE
ncbi:M20 family peptidase [Candidatus Thorarchaeota archaeon]|nr:MAG: M20 family peptidase [Candidatus Thorarchaeota archaeon]